MASKQTELAQMDNERDELCGMLDQLRLAVSVKMERQVCACGCDTMWMG